MKILYITTISQTMIFFPDLIRSLLDDGHTVDIACSEPNKIRECYLEWGCRVHPIDCSRSPLKYGNIKAIGQIRRLVEKEQYDIVHCHTPIAAACTRLACRKARKAGTKVFYTAHGFHFFKGAPLINWLMYYPVEKLCARYTDVLVTINKEDYAIAGKKLRAKRVEHVPGVGVDLSRFENNRIDKAEIRRGLGIPEDATVLLSVGELNDNKNHRVILRAMAQLNDPQIHYMIAGVGENKETLTALAEELGIGKQLHLLGFRKDVPILCAAADAFCFPSKREGLAVSPMEAMASGLPVIASDIRGVNDYIEDGVNGHLCRPEDVQGFAAALDAVVTSPHKRQEYGERNRRDVQQFRVDRINGMIKALYEEESGGEQKEDASV